MATPPHMLTSLVLLRAPHPTPAACKEGYGGPDCATPCGGVGAAASYGPPGRAVGAECVPCSVAKTGYSYDWNGANDLFAPRSVAKLGAAMSGDCLAEFVQVRKGSVSLLVRSVMLCCLPGPPNRPNCRGKQVLTYVRSCACCTCPDFSLVAQNRSRIVPGSFRTQVVTWCRPATWPAHQTARHCAPATACSSHTSTRPARATSRTMLPPPWQGE